MDPLSRYNQPTECRHFLFFFKKSNFRKQAFKNTIEERCSQKLEGQKRAKVDVECINTKEEHQTPIYEKNANDEIIGSVGGIYASYQLKEERKNSMFLSNSIITIFQRSKSLGMLY